MNTVKKSLHFIITAGSLASFLTGWAMLAHKSNANTSQVANPQPITINMPAIPNVSSMAGATPAVNGLQTFTINQNNNQPLSPAPVMRTGGS